MNNFFAFIKNNKKIIIKYFILVFGIISFGFTYFKFSIPVFAFIYPGCFYYFLKNEKPLKGLIITFVSLIFGSLMFLWSVVISESGFGFDLLLAILISIIFLIPYLLDKLIYQKYFNKSKLLLTFLFTLTFISIEILLELFPLGTLLSIAYSQVFNSVLINVASLFGLYFVSFIIIFTSISFTNFINQIIKKEKTKNKSLLIIPISLILISSIYGGIYKASYRTSETFQVMNSTSPNEALVAEEREYKGLAFNCEFIKKDIDIAKNNKVSLLTFPEESFYLKENDISGFQNYILNEIKDSGLYVVLGVEIRDDSSEYKKNQAWMFSPNNEVKTYNKCNPLPIDEYNVKPSDNPLIYMDTPFGKIGVVLCFDIEFNNFITQCGRNNVDTLIVLSWFWETVPQSTYYIDSFRAIENGCNVIKNVEDGYSIAFDCVGNVRCEYFSLMKEKDYSKYYIFSMPTKTRKTIYPYINYVINYGFIASLIALLTINIIKNYKNKKKEN